jgi:hypothetical protein
MSCDSALNIILIRIETLQLLSRIEDSFDEYNWYMNAAENFQQFRSHLKKIYSSSVAQISPLAWHNFLWLKKIPGVCIMKGVV